MGCLNLIGDVDFTGTLDAKIQESAGTIKDIQMEWKGYNEKAHAREELNRWGKCYDWSSSSDDEDDEEVSGSNGSGACVYPLSQ